MEGRGTSAARRAFRALVMGEREREREERAREREKCDAMLPSGVEVRRFARARAPELQSLHLALNATKRRDHEEASDGANANANAGGLANSAGQRHPALRRRTTSYNRRKPFWWATKSSKPAAGEQPKRRKLPLAVADSIVGEKAEGGNGCGQGSDVKSLERAVEGDAAQLIGNAMPLKGSFESSARKRKETAKKNLSRRVRRRIELKGSSDGQGGQSSDGTQRLATHLWHAKRFEMTKIWGYWLAKGFPGRGRGSRALLKMAKNGALMHDASYYSAIEMKGCMDVLLETLELVLEPFPSALTSLTDAVKSEDSCACYENAMLHQLEKAPYKPIAPVMVVWRPPCLKLQSHDLGHLTGDCTFSTCDNTEPKTFFRKSQDEERHLWIWVHAAAFDIALQALQSACHKKVTKYGKAIVSCQSRKGELARLDVVGARAFQVLQKVLSPVTSSMYNGASRNASNINLVESLKAGDEGRFRFLGLQQTNRLPDKAILSMEVHDPRNLPKVGPIPCTYAAKHLENILQNGINFSGESSNQEKCTTNSVLVSDLSPTFSEAHCSRSSPEDVNMVFQGGLSSCHRLWKCDSCSDSHLIKPPVSVKSLCARKHKDRLSFFHINHETNTTTNLDKSPLSGGSTCPILLVKHLCRGSSACRWSIILPMSWVRAFWLPLLSAGARAIGQREYRWFLTDAGFPSFPFDFPDVLSYAVYKGVESRLSKWKFQQGLSKEPLENLSFPPPWMCMLKDIDGQTWTASKSEARREDFLDLDCNGPLLYSSGKGETGKPGEKTWEQLLMKFPGFVARTTWALDIFLKENNLRHLLIFPGGGNYSKYFVQGELKKRNLAWQAASSEKQQYLQCTTVVNLFKELKTPCFLRVLIRAPRKGVLQERAVIFSPTVQDLNAWFSRSNIWQGTKQTTMFDPTLNVTIEGVASKDSNITSKNLEQSPVISLKKEVDQKAKCIGFICNRPIGYVTSPAPRQSIKDFASAFIELCSLGKIRSMQLADKRWGNSKEIFCLFKNERSDTFRPALALIVLEATDDIT